LLIDGNLCQLVYQTKLLMQINWMEKNGVGCIILL